MKRALHRIVLVALFLLAMGKQAQGAEWNPTDSDNKGNTAGGPGPLFSIADGLGNQARRH